MLSLNAKLVTAFYQSIGLKNEREEVRECTLIAIGQSGFVGTLLYRVCFH